MKYWERFTTLKGMHKRERKKRLIKVHNRERQHKKEKDLFKKELDKRFRKAHKRKKERKKEH